MDARDGFGVGSFGDARRAAAGAFLFERIVSTGSLVVRRLGMDRAGEISVHRFLSSPAVTLAEIAETAAARTAAACRGCRIVAVQSLPRRRPGILPRSILPAATVGAAVWVQTPAAALAFMSIR